MAISSFVPKTWSPKLLETYHRDLIFQALANRDYEAEALAMGDTVHIGALVDLTVRPYSTNNALASPEMVNGNDRTLVLGHTTYVHAYVPDTVEAETQASMTEALKANANRRLREDLESYLYEIAIDAAGITGSMDATGDMASQILGIMTAMDSRGVQRRGRSLLVPCTLEGMLPTYNAAKGAIMAPGAAAAKLGARFNFAGFDIYGTTELTDTVIALAPGAIQYAARVTLETYRLDGDFATGVKGFLLAGAKVVLPDGCAFYDIS